MKKIFLLVTAFICIACYSISCKKDKKDCSLTQANLAGSYKIGSVKYKKSSSSSEQDGTNFFDACQLDDVTTFNNNNTYATVDAGVKCDPSDDDSGTWSISGNDLITDGDSAAVSNFSCSGFTISESNIDTTGDLLSVTFKKQ